MKTKYRQMRQARQEILQVVRRVVDELLRSRLSIRVSDIEQHPEIKGLGISGTSLRGLITELLQEGFIIQVQEARGRQPALYAKPDRNLDWPEQAVGSILDSKNESRWKVVEEIVRKLFKLIDQENEIDQKILELRNQKQIIRQEVIDLRLRLRLELVQLHRDEEENSNSNSDHI